MSELTNQLEVLKEPMALGQVFSESGFFPDAKTQAQAVVKIMAGRELGLSPFQAMSGIYMINGRLALQAGVMSSLIKRSKKYDYTVDEHTAEGCKISSYDTTKEEHRLLGVREFTTKDAAKAGIVNGVNWKNYPKNMVFARALSNGARWFCPDVICGWYTSEEMQDVEPAVVEPMKTIIELTAEGEVVNGTPETSV